MKGRKSGAIFCHLCHIMQQERGVQGKTLCNHQPKLYAVGRSTNLWELMVGSSSDRGPFKEEEQSLFAAAKTGQPPSRILVGIDVIA